MLGFICSPFAVHLQSICSPFAVHLQSICTPFAIHSQSIRHPFAIHLYHSLSIPFPLFRFPFPTLHTLYVWQ